MIVNGVLMFRDVYELTYELLSEMEMEVKSDGTIIDSRTKNILAFNGLIIKASINPYDIKYAGQGEIMLDLLNNLKMVNMIFGYYIERKQNAGMPLISYFQEEKIDEADIKYSSLSVKHDSTHTTTSNYFHNKCLKFIEMIFILEENSVNLSNFDVLEGA